MSIRLVIADDQALVRAGFTSLLATDPQLVVVGEAADGMAAVEAVTRHRPDVVLMDIRMPVLDGIEATRRITAGAGSTRVLILTTYDLDEYVFDALRAGAAGFLLKDAPLEQLTNAVRTVATGNALLDPAVTRRVIEAFAAAGPPPSMPRELARLTEREGEVLALVARGLSNDEIAADLRISHATAKTHVSAVLTKLGLRDRIHAVIYAYEHGLNRPGA